MNIPNLISIARICAVPVVIWLILTNQMLAAFWLALIAGISDAVDGIIAKKFHMETVLGAFLDPIADKVLLVCVFVTLGHEGFLPIWLVILVVFRDAVIVGGALLFHTITHSLTMQPLFVSKANTVAQIVLAVGILGFEGFGIEDGLFRTVMIAVVAATTLASGIAYVAIWTRRAQEYEPG